MSAGLATAVLLTAWWSGTPAAPPGAAVAFSPSAGSTVAALPADDPVTLSRDSPITDRVDALDGRRDDVVRALDRLYDDQRLQLFVVYVRDFSGRTAQEWADATARRNGLGTDDVLLAVATHDRQFAYWAPATSRLTDAQLADVARTAVVPPLRQNDWAGAAVGAADGYAATLSGRAVPTPAITPGDPDPGAGTATGTGAADLVIPVGVAVAVVGTAAYAAVRRRRRTATRTTPQGGRAGWSSGPESAPGESTAELDARARQALVDVDDALRTSQEELGFATAQFGDEAARPFLEAVAYARDELTTAFRVRQRLDDAHPEDDTTRRRMLAEILARCQDADRRLDAESADFDRLRDLERNAPQALTAVQERFTELNGRIISTEAALAVMRERYAASASDPVAGDAAGARDRLVFAKTAVDRARTALDDTENAAAAVQIRAAEGALAQTDRLTEAVDRRARELAEAVGALPGALTETDSDLAEARGMLSGTAPGESTAGLRGRIARAETVAADVRREMEGRYDPIDALRRLEEADAALDEALTGARVDEEEARRARTLLGQATLGARAAVGAAADYIATHRGAVGSRARTRLAEAQRRLELSERLATGAAGPAEEEAGEGEASPAVSGADGNGGTVTGGEGRRNARAALAEAQRADALAREAQRLAEEDVRGFGNPFGPGGASQAGSAGGGLGGAVLGGIVLGGLFGGGGRRGSGGGGFGGFGSGSGYGGFGGGFEGRPGSFGGGGTRGRMGGGRF
ncbi:TPM domain-containing protein [Streptomyces sp. NPDC059248]|uniref:TPM domain-containing protein n=1 Tax=Streptomyces sp. NPDC059248 TaxID=3346791 RepID=UPI003697D399